MFVLNGYFCYWCPEENALHMPVMEVKRIFWKGEGQKSIDAEVKGGRWVAESAGRETGRTLEVDMWLIQGARMIVAWWLPACFITRTHLANLLVCRYTITGFRFARQDHRRVHESASLLWIWWHISERLSRCLSSRAWRCFLSSHVKRSKPKSKASKQNCCIQLKF